MARRLAVISGAAALLVLATALVTLHPRVPSAEAGEVTIAMGKSCPLTVPATSVLMEIVDIVFTDVVQGAGGNKMALNEEQKKNLRLGLVTVKVTKPAGMRLSLAAADLTLHYYHGSEAEVAPCEGISSFSTSLDTDRPMELSKTMGPGFTKQHTGARATQVSVLYFDAVFGFMEPDTKECWLCVGQPSTSAPFASKGWTQ